MQFNTYYRHASDLINKPLLLWSNWWCWKLLLPSGYTLILCNTGGIYEKQRDYIRMLAEKRVDGILVMCSDLTEELRGMLDRHADIPKVVMDWGLKPLQADKIIDNSEEGGYLATKYLLERGHTKIACLSGHLDKAACVERIAGYKRALNEAKVATDEKLIIEGNFECDTAVLAADKIAQMEGRPTAVFCFNDTMALGLIWVACNSKVFTYSWRYFGYRLRQHWTCKNTSLHHWLRFTNLNVVLVKMHSKFCWNALKIKIMKNVSSSTPEIVWKHS